MTTDSTRTWIRRASTAAGLAYTAIAEYELARRLGARPYIAVMLPMSIDCYVIAALKWFRPFDVTLSLILMCAAQVAAHALEADVVVVNLELVTVVSVLVPVALWRTHALARDEHETPAEPIEAEAIRSETTVEVERVPVAVLAAEAPRTRVSAPVSEDDGELLARTRADFNGRIPTYRELKEMYGIGQPRAARIRAVLEGELS